MEGCAIPRQELILRLLAPWFAVGLFWLVWPQAWLAVLAYHAQILLWNRPRLRALRGHRGGWFGLPMVVCALAGPLMYLLLPVITRTGFIPWLEGYGLTGTALVLMVPYYGLVHPFLEQIHWSPLREATAWSHPLFAGYHLLVLGSLLTLPWLLVCFAVLVASSLWWRWAVRRTGSLAVPALTHLLADLGIVLAAWARAAG